MRLLGAGAVPRWRQTPLLVVIGASAFVLLTVLAYRLPLAVRLDIGGGPAGGVFDQPYLGGFNSDPEPTAADRTLAYRWAFGDAKLHWPGLGTGAYQFALQVVAAGPQPASSQWQLNNEPLIVVPLQSAPRRYHLLLPSHRPDLDLRITTPTFRAGNDPRDLAFAADWVTLTRPRPAPVAWPVVGWSLLILALLAALGWLWQLPMLARALLLITSGLLLAALLAWQRLALTTALPRIAGLLAAGLVLSAALTWLLGSLVRRWQPQASSQARAVAALVVLAWLVRSIALLHPQALTSDAGLHANNLRGVAQGQLIFTENLTGEAGGGPAPYPPGGYVVLAPALLVLEPRLLVTLGTALGDSLVVAGIWLLYVLAELPLIMTLGSGALYLFALPSLRSLSVGEMANVWAQVLVVPLAISLFAWQSYVAAPPDHQARGKHPAWLPQAAVIAWGSVALLGHFGVFLSLLAFGGVYSLLLLVRRLPHTPRLIGCLIVACLGAIIVYYAVWTAIILNRPAAPPASTNGLERVWGQLRALANLRHPIGPLLLGLGLAGLVQLWRERQRLWLLLLAWWAAGLLSLAPLLISQQALRWQLWLFPAIALGGGIVLGKLWQRGPRGQILAGALLALCLGRGAWLWLNQIATYQHF